MIDDLIAYEDGKLDGEGTLRLFSELVRTGNAWTLQGHYGRTASGLIRSGWLSPSGEILNPDDDGEA